MAGCTSSPPPSTSGAAAQDAPADLPCRVADLPAYSHNDYERSHPLLTALALGYGGVEVDVFAVEGRLRVGHSRRGARRAATIDSLYLVPLAARLARCGRLTAPGRPFLLTVEVKERSAETHDSLVATLSRFAERVGIAEGERDPRLAVVLVGWHPADTTVARELRGRPWLGVQWRLREPADSAAAATRDVHLVSLDYGKTMGRARADRAAWLAALRAVKRGAPHRLVRVFDVSTDAALYETLLANGADVIGTKDLAGTAGALRGTRSSSAGDASRPTTPSPHE